MQPGHFSDEAADPGLAIPPDVLAVDPEVMRALGYAMVDRTVDHLLRLPDLPAIREGSPAELRAAVGGPVPVAAHDLASDLALLADTVLANQQHGDHPRYFARVAGPSSFPGILADWLGTGLQSVAASWGGASGPTTVELVALEWLRDALGLANDCEGILLSGGSMANINGLIAARHLRGAGVVYLTDQTHASIPRGLRAMGQPDEDLRFVGTDDQLRFSPSALRQAIERDIQNGRRPAIVIATAGTTNTGAVDDLVQLAELCRQYDMWLHVDGAFGGAAALSPRGRKAMPGLELADSFVTDPHKWLFQPYDIACLFVRGAGSLEQTFAMHPEYLADLAGDQVDLHNRSLELTRRSRALKLWLTFRAYGLPTLQQAIDRGIALGEHAQRCIEARPELEIVTPAQLGIVTFAGRARTDAEHKASIAALNHEGFAAASSTVLRGQTVFRLCIINPRTTLDDIDATLDRLVSNLGS